MSEFSLKVSILS